MAHSHRHTRRNRRIFGRYVEMSNLDIFLALVSFAAIIVACTYGAERFTDCVKFLFGES